MERFQVAIEKDSDGSYIAYNNDESKFSMIGRGDSVSEAKADFYNSMEEIKNSITDDGEAVPNIFNNTPVFKFDLASLFEYYSMLNITAFAKFVGINATLMRQYKMGNTYISEKQLTKIEQGIHKLGNEFSGLKLV